MENKAETEIHETECQIIKVLFSCIPLLLIGGLAPLIAFNECLIPDNEKLSSWFQRSGSISVLFGVWAEYNLSKINEHINLSGVVISSQTQLSEKYKFKYKSAHYLAVLLAIIGTLIWGYGDIFINFST